MRKSNKTGFWVFAWDLKIGGEENGGLCFCFCKIWDFEDCRYMCELVG